MSGLWPKAVQQRLDTIEWVDQQSEPFELMDAERALGFTNGLIRGVLRDMEARGLVERYRGDATGRATPQGGAQMWRNRV